MSARSRSLLNIFETTSGMKMMIDYSQIAGADHMPTFKCTVYQVTFRWLLFVSENQLSTAFFLNFYYYYFE